MSEREARWYVLWHCQALASSEYASLVEHDDGVQLTGRVALALEEAPCFIAYDVGLDREWCPRYADVTVTTPGTTRSIRLRSAAPRRWELDGAAAPELDGCTDLDLGFTPATNTVPIRRLNLAVGEARTITAAWLRFPELVVVPDTQTYTRVAGERWRYEAGDYSFELVTDGRSGLVLQYGDDLWRARCLT
jgi:hypothetical protein